MTSFARPDTPDRPLPGSAVVALLLTLLVHAVALLWWPAQSLPPKGAGPSVRATTAHRIEWVLLPTATPPPAPPRAGMHVMPRPTAPDQSDPDRHRRPLMPTPSPSTAPASARVSVEAPQDDPTTRTTTSPAPPVHEAPLRLDLPARSPGSAWPSRSAAVDDPRANTRPLTDSERFDATVSGTQGFREERFAEGLRIHSGTGCVEVRHSRIAALDPHNEGFMPRPKGTQPCR